LLKGSEHNEKRCHPTQKPAALATECFELFKPGDTIFDGFAGSGSTMVACQNLNRKCRGIEISENYCAVILERMKTAFPGIEIRRIE
jgi:DNA modification methylase